MRFRSEFKSYLRLPNIIVVLAVSLSTFTAVNFSLAEDSANAQNEPDVYVAVLGVAQDAGYPQLGCRKDCCKPVWNDPSQHRYTSCIAVIDRKANQRFVFDCTPDFKLQMHLLDQIAGPANGQVVDGVFLTHGHMGHYTGLIHLGIEAIGASEVPVFGTTRMNEYLKTNGPWSQLVRLKNIELRNMDLDKPIQLTERVRVAAFRVPHRDEYTDTVGFKISTDSKSLVYLPDIDKWSKWDRSIDTVVADTDVALLDGSFFADGELPGRDMAQIPHPFIEESIARFSSLPANVRQRIKFIHLNHTNPAIQNDGDPKVNAAARKIYQAGMGLARQGEKIALSGGNGAEADKESKGNGSRP